MIFRKKTGRRFTYLSPLFFMTTCSALALPAGLTAKAEAHQRISHKSLSRSASYHRGHPTFHHARYPTRHRKGHGHVIQCVAYAKSASDVVIQGNAREWWDNAQGVYARGLTPEPGSILSFRGSRRMPYGHVAVVRAVENNRTIVIDQSHWGQSGISRNIRVIDVSSDNDWSSVRVALSSQSTTFGSIYSTHGFIYPRPDNKVMSASNISTSSRHEASLGLGQEKRKVGTFTPASQVEVAAAPDIAFAAEGPDRGL